MNIPLAYDLVPAGPDGSVAVNHGAPVGYLVPAGVGVAHNQNVAYHGYASQQQQQHQQQQHQQQQYVNNGQALLLPVARVDGGYGALSDDPDPSSAEGEAQLRARWASELAEQGASGLPLERYRQSPSQAVWSAYGIINRVLGSLINFGINVGLGYAVLSGNDEVGLWQEPSEWGSKPYKSAAWSDLLLTAALIAFLTTVLSTSGIRAAIKKGQTLPVDAAQLRAKRWSLLRPVHVQGTCSRAALLAAWAVLLPGVLGVGVLEIVCLAGALHGSGSQCSMERTTYIFVKAAFAVVVGWACYPTVLLMTLNTATLPPLDQALFVQAQKERYDQEQRQAAGQPQPM